MRAGVAHGRPAFPCGRGGQQWPPIGGRRGLVAGSAVSEGGKWKTTIVRGRGRVGPADARFTVICGAGVSRAGWGLHQPSVGTTAASQDGGSGQPRSHRAG